MFLHFLTSISLQQADTTTTCDVCLPFSRSIFFVYCLHSNIRLNFYFARFIFFILYFGVSIPFFYSSSIGRSLILSIVCIGSVIGCILLNMHLTLRNLMSLSGLILATFQLSFSYKYILVISQPSRYRNLAKIIKF